MSLNRQTLQDIESLDPEKHGFEREEIRAIPSDMPDSFAASNVHIFLNTASLRPPEWESLLKNVPNFPEVNAHFQALKESQSEFVLPKSVSDASAKDAFRLTVCHNTELGGDGELVVFNGTNTNDIVKTSPTAMRVTTLSAKALLASSTTTSTTTPCWLDTTIAKPLASNVRLVFICSHVQRDPRCGMCGALLVDLLQKELSKLKDQLAVTTTIEPAEAVTATATAGTKSSGLLFNVRVCPCSHVGGHKYAGNVIVMGQEGGFCFGCVTPQDVPQFAKILLCGKSLAQDMPKDKLRGSLIFGGK